MIALQLFAVIPSEQAVAGVSGVSFVPFRAIAGVVSETPYRRQELDDETVAKYADMVEKLYGQSAVLPAPPGTVFRSRALLSRWLELHYVALTDALAFVDGQATARVTVRLREGATSDETTREWQVLANDSLRLLRGQATAILTVDSEQPGDEAVVARSSFLMDRERWDAFTEAVATERRRHPHLDFALTGPWPPYDFVRMQFGT